MIDFGDNDPLIGIEDICKKLGISRSTFERLRNRGLKHAKRASMSILGRDSLDDENFDNLPEFPKPTVTLGRSPRWSVKVLNAWIKKCK